ncbi:MAG: hypothetical protein FWF10_09700 [Clostridiales bacterium]|nr:hypothetical protein [Clostridiales bacterium]
MKRKIILAAIILIAAMLLGILLFLLLTKKAPEYSCSCANNNIEAEDGECVHKGSKMMYESNKDKFSRIAEWIYDITPEDQMWYSYDIGQKDEFLISVDVYSVHRTDGYVPPNIEIPQWVQQDMQAIVESLKDTYIFVRTRYYVDDEGIYHKVVAFEYNRSNDQNLSLITFVPNDQTHFMEPYMGPIGKIDAKWYAAIGESLME